DGSQSFTLNHLADLFVNVWWSRVLIDSTILFFLLVCGFIVGLMFYRFGTIGGISFLAVIFLTFVIGMTQGWLLEFFISVFQDITLLFFGQLFLVALGLYLLTFFLLRRLTIS